jgi:hypothetical protein
VLSVISATFEKPSAPSAPPASEATSAKPAESSGKPNGDARPNGNAGSRPAAPAASAGGQVIIMVKASDITPRAKDWIWEGHILRRALGLLTGLPGVGKSQGQCDFVARATTGKAWPNNGAAVAPMNVIMVTAEDALDEEVVPRLMAAGADRERIYILKCIKTDESTRRQFLLGSDLFKLERAIKKIGDVGLVTIDPITAYMGSGKFDSHKATDVRSQLGPLKDFAERCGVAVSAITHPPKSAGPNALDHFIGSQAFIAAARIGHIIVDEVDDDGRATGRKLFTNPKNNPGLRQPTLAYRISAIVIDERNGVNIAAPRVTWEEGTVAVSADEALARARANRADGRDRGGEQRACQEFLKEFLGDGGRHLATDVEAEGERRGFTKRQVRRAKEKLRVRSEKDEGNPEGPWFWVLPF